MTERYGYDKTPTPTIDYDVSKVPPEIKKRTTWVKTKFTGEDVAEAYGQVGDIAGIYASEAKQLAERTQIRQDAVEDLNNQVIQEMTDKDVISAPEIIAARGDKPTLQARLDETTAQLVQTLRRTQSVVNIEEFGAVGNYKFETGTGADNAEAINNALATLTERGTLLIPEGFFFVGSEINIHCNVNCIGTIVVPNDVEGTFISFNKSEEVIMQANEVFDTLASGSKKLSVKASSPYTAEEISHYHFTLESNELLITRILGAEPQRYTKNESGTFEGSVASNVILKDELKHSYTSLVDVTLTLSKKTVRRDIDNFKVVRNSGTAEEYEQRLVAVRGNNLFFNGGYIDNLGTAIHIGLALQKAHDIHFNNFYTKDIEGNVGKDTYAILNNVSSYIYFDGYTYVSSSVTGQRGYSGIHGGHVRFINSDVIGVDDHWGYDYIFDRGRLGSTGITFAGGGFKIKDSEVKDALSVFTLRSDTPYAIGTLDFENVSFIRCGRVVTGQINGGDYNLPLKFFDKIKFKNCTRDGSSVLGNPQLINLGIATGSYTNVVEVGDIEIDGCDFDSATILLNHQVKFNISEIKINKLKWNKSSVYQNNYSFVRLDGEHQIGRILIENSNDGGVFCDASRTLPSIGKIIYRNCKFKDTAVRLVHGSESAGVVEYLGCEFDKVWGHPLLGMSLEINGNTFITPSANLLTKDTTNTGALAYSQGNKASADANLARLPELDGYLNATYYKKM